MVAGTPPTRVLVVDDEPTVREVVAGYLRRDGHAVSEAGDGDTALELLERERPDLVVLDMMLPGVNGLDVLRRIRAAGDLPVIMLTARSEESDRVAGLELGADDYVVKPFSPRELAARVNSVLRRAAPEDTCCGRRARVRRVGRSTRGPARCTVTVSSST